MTLFVALIMKFIFEHIESFAHLFLNVEAVR